MKYLFFSFLAFSANLLSAQSSSEIQISFVPNYAQTSLVLNESLGAENLQIETLKFYISQVELYKEQELVFAEANSYHLIDAADAKTLNLKLDIPNKLSYSQLKFKIGIDSLTNVSGAFGGDLDPTNGMYWTWQSGYINFKLEGTAQNCPARKNQFQFHIGGYQYPFNTLQNVALEITTAKDLKINIELDKLLAQINLKENYQVMSPNQRAVELAALLPSLFSISR